MSRLPELHWQLVQAARRQEEQERELGWLLRFAGRPFGRCARTTKGVGGFDVVRRLRPLLLALGGVLATTTIALAASGVIPIGTPVPPNKHLSRDAGLGLPQPGGSKLLALRAHDPRGGLPWGMRIVRTSREEVCLQVGRVQDGELGELGIDGAFHDDGELHPLPDDALPTALQSIGSFTARTNTACILAGKAATVATAGMPASDAGTTSDRPRSLPAKDLRDVFYGILGPDAVSVSYREGATERTVPVQRGTGAYLIVRPAAANSALRSGLPGASIGTPGQLSPNRGGLLTRIVYRFDGVDCERLSTAAPRDAAGRPCPSGGRPAEGPHGQSRELHEPLEVHLQIRKQVVRSARVSFRAPYTVRSARYDYAIFLPQPPCRKSETEEVGGTLAPLYRDVARGEIVSANVIYPFLPIRDRCAKERTTIEVVYESLEGPERTIVAKATLKQPPHTRGGPHAPLSR